MTTIVSLTHSSILFSGDDCVNAGAGAWFAGDGSIGDEAFPMLLPLL